MVTGRRRCSKDWLIGYLFCFGWYFPVEVYTYQTSEVLDEIQVSYRISLPILVHRREPVAVGVWCIYVSKTEAVFGVINFSNNVLQKHKNFWFRELSRWRDIRKHAYINIAYIGGGNKVYSSSSYIMTKVKPKSWGIEVLRLNAQKKLLVASWRPIDCNNRNPFNAYNEAFQISFNKRKIWNKLMAPPRPSGRTIPVYTYIFFKLWRVLTSSESAISK